MTDRQIILMHGTDYRHMAMELLRASGFAGEHPDRGIRIGIKPNLVVAAAAEGGATTHPELVAGVIDYLRENGFSSVCVLEGSWVGARTDAAFRASGIGKVCEERGIPYFDLQKDSGVQVDARGMRLNVCARLREIDLLINMPVVKGHCQTVMTCALKNLKGLLPNSEKRRFHTMGLHDPIGHLVTVMPEMFCLADNICGDLDFEEGGNPVVMNRIYCCKDPVLCDAFACRTMGWKVSDVPYIKIAESLGAGSADLSTAEITALNKAAAEPPQRMSRRVRELARYTAPKDACSACYGALIHALDRMERGGRLRHSLPDICIGQGYRGETGDLGVGNCCGAFRCHVPGCPPSSEDMIRFLSELT